MAAVIDDSRSREKKGCRSSDIHYVRSDYPAFQSAFGPLEAMERANEVVAAESHWYRLPVRIAESLEQRGGRVISPALVAG